MVYVREVESVNYHPIRKIDSFRLVKVVSFGIVINQEGKVVPTIIVEAHAHYDTSYFRNGTEIMAHVFLSKMGRHLLLSLLVPLLFIVVRVVSALSSSRGGGIII